MKKRAWKRKLNAFYAIMYDGDNESDIVRFIEEEGYKVKKHWKEHGVLGLIYGQYETLTALQPCEYIAHQRPGNFTTYKKDRFESMHIEVY